MLYIYEDSLVFLAKRGHLSLQIGVPVISRTPVAGCQEIPDEWICELHNNHPVTGREKGFFFFTRAGYAANKEKLKIAFEESGKDFSAFEAYAEMHFKAIEKSVKKYIKMLKSKLKQAEEFIV